MIDLYYWTTPNGHKITMFLEETDMPYKLFPVNIGKDEQFKPDFLKISPNNKIPAIVDHDPKGGGAPVSIFESGAILLYLAEKLDKLLPQDIAGRAEVLQWLFWQVGGLGPMAGQNSFFRRQKEANTPAIERYTNETKRLFGVLDKRLSKREFIAGDTYTIADIACYPWVAPYEMLHMDLAEFAQVKRWLATIAARPSTERAYALAKEINPSAPVPNAPPKKQAS
jgi:GST-like protein